MTKQWETATYPPIPQRATDGSGPSYDSGSNEGWFAKVCATLNIGFDSMKSELRGMRMDARRASAPVMNWLPQSVVIAANGIGVIRFGGPDQGHFWYIRRLTVGGLSPTTVVTGRADAFVSAGDMRQPFAAGATSSMDWRDFSPTLPNILHYGAAEMPLRLNEEFYVVFTGVGAGQQVVSCIGYFDYEEASMNQEWGL